MHTFASSIQMTVQVPNPCVPYPRLDPITGPLVHLATNLSAIYAETARSAVPIKTGKEKSVVRTRTNNFLAECMDSMAVIDMHVG